jgi:aspartate/methionine/tyrosine aminotransferase
LAEGALVFALGGLSKELGLPGVKLSWIAVAGVEPALSQALSRLELICDGYLSVSTPVQVALPRLLFEGRVVTQRIQERLSENLTVLRAAVDPSPASLFHVEGGWYACLRLPDLVSEETWVVALLEEDGVLVHPGWFYDFVETPVAVVSLLTEPDVFRMGLGRLVERVRARST